MRKKIGFSVHLIYYVKGELRYKFCCGATGGIRFATWDWEEVTCKACLKSDWAQFSANRTKYRRRSVTAGRARLMDRLLKKAGLG